MAAGINAGGAAEGCIPISPLNSANAIVQRDAAGNFSAGTITATLLGNASTAAALARIPSDCVSGVAAGINAGGVAQGCVSVASANTANAIVQRNAFGNFFGGIITASDFTYPAAQTRYHAISSAAFTPPNSAEGYASNWIAGNDRYSTGGSRLLAASMTVPHGATVTNLQCTVRDTSMTSGVSIGIGDLISNAWQCGPVTSSANIGDKALVALACNFVADNVNQANIVRFFPADNTCGASCAVYGCSVTFTVPGPR